MQAKKAITANNQQHGKDNFVPPASHWPYPKVALAA